MSVETVKTQKSNKEESQTSSSDNQISFPPAKKIKSSNTLEEINILKPKRVPSAGENATSFIKQRLK